MRICAPLLLLFLLCACQPSKGQKTSGGIINSVVNGLTAANDFLGRKAFDPVDAFRERKVIETFRALPTDEANRAFLTGWYSGMFKDNFKSFFSNGLGKWVARDGCDVENAKKAFFSGYSERSAAIRAAFRDPLYKTKVDTVNALVSHAEFIEKINALLRKSIENEACGLKLLMGPALMFEALLPSFTAAWGRRNFMSRINLANVGDSNSGHWALAGRALGWKEGFVASQISAFTHRACSIFFMGLKESLGSKFPSPLVEPINLVIAQHVVTEKKFGQKDGTANYAKAAAFFPKDKHDRALTNWRLRNLDTFLDNVRDEYKLNTMKQFGEAMLVTKEQVMPPSSIKMQAEMETSAASMLEVADGDGDDIFVDLDEPVSQAGFNWLKGREACRLDKPSDQAKCASCWSFSVTGALDYRLCGSLLRNNLPLLGSIKRPDGSIWRDPSTKLSNQVCLSCTAEGGCNGGKPADCVDYIKSSSVTTHSCVPYTSWKDLIKGTCPRANTCPAGRDKDNTRGNSVTILNAGYVTGIANIKAALASGPVTFVINTPATFISWGGQGNKADGVFSSKGAPTVDGAHSNHIMVAFGWGVVNGVEVLLVLNSWGAIYNQFTFMGMTFNNEVMVKDGAADVPRGPWLLIDANDPALGIGGYPAFWVTPGLRVGGKVVPIKANWK